LIRLAPVQALRFPIIHLRLVELVEQEREVACRQGEIGSDGRAELYGLGQPAGFTQVQRAAAQVSRGPARAGQVRHGRHRVRVSAHRLVNVQGFLQL